MTALWYVLLIAAAFCIGACPFAVWISRWLLHKDIRDYGDHNPGAANVFKAGGRASGFLAVFLEIAKGIVPVVIARLLSLSDPLMYGMGLGAVLGHAFSPILRFRGGKATAVTYGTLIALPHIEILLVFTLLMFLIFFILDGDSWRVVIATGGALIVALALGPGTWLSLYMLCVLTVIAIKNWNGIQTVPRLKQKIRIGFS